MTSIASNTNNLLPYYIMITFRIQYDTVWGEQVGVLLTGENSPVMLSTANGHSWEGTTDIVIPHDENHLATYRYGVWRNGELVRVEMGRQPHSFLVTPKDTHYVLCDSWRDMPRSSYLFTTAFSGGIQNTAGPSKSESQGGIVLRVLSPTLTLKGQVLGITGASVGLGEWEKPSPMVQTAPNQWQIVLDVRTTEETEYKYVAMDSISGKIQEWEEGDNRRLYVPSLPVNTRYHLVEEEVYLPSCSQKIAGTAVPVFSLRSQGSQGVGDFGDLKAMVDWCLRTRQRALQILPINDTTKCGEYTDSYPYSSISIYAFHPMYIDLRQLTPVKKARGAKILDELSALNELPAVDYPAVNRLKHEYLKLLFEQTGKQTLKSSSYTEFYQANKDWLLPYAAFCYLRDQYGTPDYRTWKVCSVYSAEQVEKLHEKHSKEIDYYTWIQFLLHLQLLAATSYARDNGIIIKGDIPIGIDRNSVEAWQTPHLFNMNGSAGAPPDAFSTKGQNWGFPTYNWDVMALDNYAWWKRRFRKMAEYFSAYRIDHILGFFRIWEIPTHSVHGLLGQFSPALPMTEEEIEQWGLHFQEEFMTQPFINEELIRRSFGEHAEQVKRTFLKNIHHDIWQLRPEYQTQRQIETWFNLEHKNPLPDKVKESLYALVSNVLFVRDKEGRGWHPRIAAQSSYIFSRLTWDEQQAFTRLYNHYFYERHNQYWYDMAMKKLPTLLNCSPLLPCGEDLGMVPDCVPWVMEQLQILSLEIERMPKDPEQEFGQVSAYPNRSVCTIGTHDMSTLRGWWKESPVLTQRYYNEILTAWGQAPDEAPADICEQVVRRHLESPSVLCILALQDWFAIDEELRLKDPEAERINVPANPKHYWQYRMHLSIEQLMQASGFNSKIATLILATR